MGNIQMEVVEKIKSTFFDQYFPLVKEKQSHYRPG
jgi:hypothetical protein